MLWLGPDSIDVGNRLWLDKSGLGHRGAMRNFRFAAFQNTVEVVEVGG